MAAALLLAFPPAFGQTQAQSQAASGWLSWVAPVKRLLGDLIAQAPGAGGASVPAVPSTPTVPVPPKAAAPDAPASGGPKFEVRRYDVEGVTLLTPARIEKALAPFTGRDRDFGSVQQALEALERLFVAEGYGSVQVLLPEQELDSGVVKFKVIEPRLAKVTVEGNKAYSEENILASLPALRPGSAPNSAEIASNLRAANENPGKGTTVLLRAGAQDGEVDAIVRVNEDRPMKFSVSLDNTGAGRSGVYRLGVGAQFANLWGRDHVLSVQAITSPNQGATFQGYSSDVAVLGVSYRIPIYRYGDFLDFSAGYSNVNTGNVQNIFSVSGRGSVAGVRYTKNLPKFGDIEHRLIAAWDWRDYVNSVTPINNPGQQIIPNITVQPMSLTYAATLRNTVSETSAYLGFSQNITSGSGDSSRTQFERVRANARPGYRIWRYGFQHYRAFANDWQARFNLAGQFTRDQLVPGEQFGLGGATSIRGFNERAFANDFGHYINFEIYTPDIGSTFKLGNELKFRFLAFYDTGRVQRNRPDTNFETAYQQVNGGGVGFRLTRGNNFSVRMDAAWADAPGHTGNPALPTSTKEFRLHGAVVYIF